MCFSCIIVCIARDVFCPFSLPLGVRIGCGLRLWHSLDFSIKLFGVQNVCSVPIPTIA